VLQNVSGDSYSGTVNNYLQNMSSNWSWTMWPRTPPQGNTGLILSLSFTARDLPYDLTGRDMTWLSSRPGGTDDLPWQYRTPRSIARTNKKAVLSQRWRAMRLIYGCPATFPKFYGLLFLRYHPKERWGVPIGPPFILFLYQHSFARNFRLQFSVGVANPQFGGRGDRRGSGMVPL